MNVWRMFAQGCGPVLVAVFLSAILSTVPAARGQEAPPNVEAQPDADEYARWERKMQTLTSVEFMDTPLCDVVDFVAQHADVPFTLDEEAMTDAGVASDTPIRLHVRDVRLESVLTLLLEPLDLDWEYRDEAVLITSKAETESLVSHRVYPIGDLLKRIGEHQGSALLEAVCQISRTEWDQYGGPSSAHVLGDSLVITAVRHTHAAIGRLLSDLRRAYNLDAPPAEISATEQAAMAALGKRLDVQFEDMPLVDACRFLAEKTGTQILFDHKALTDAGVSLDSPVTHSARGVTLRSALNRLLTALDLTWIIRNEVVMVLSRAESESVLTMRLYPLGDLVADSQQAEQMLQLIVESIASTSWNEVGGPGSVKLLPSLLVVSQTQEIHEQIEKLLAKLHSGGSLRRGAENNREMQGEPGYQGYRRVVYEFKNMSPDDVAATIKTIIAPETWKVDQGSIHVIRGEVSSEPTGESAGSRGSGEERMVHRLVIVQRSDVHAQIKAFFDQLAGRSRMPRSMAAGDLFRATWGR